MVLVAAHRATAAALRDIKRAAAGGENGRAGYLRAARQGIDRILNYSMGAGVFHRAGRA